MTYPFDPLVPLIEARYVRSDFVSNVGIHGKAVQVLGCNRRSVHRWAKAGMKLGCADRAAVALGYHPSEIWPEWFQS